MIKYFYSSTIILKARAGEIKNFTGIDHPFVEPNNPDIIVETDKQEVKEITDTILNELKEMGHLPN